MKDIKQKNTGSESAPNIFNYATSELSQDAFILWLLDWANPQYAKYDKALCDTAQDFVRLLLDKEDLKITSVECKKQEHHIDVFAIVNEKFALIVEDKTNTSEHGNQIQRYYEWVKKEKKFSHLKLYCVYYKSGNESLQSIRNMNAAYKKNHPDAADILVLSRKEMINILSFKECQNEILLGYLAKLQEIDEATNSYRTKPVNEWDWRAWQGLYMMLEERFDTDLNFGWGNVSQKDGGFQGCWLCFHPIPNGEKSKLYIQIEGAPNNIKNTKVCFKICHIPNQPIDACREWSHKVIKLSHECGHPQIKKVVARFKKGKYMTVAGISGIDFFGDGMIDCEKVLSLISDYRHIVEKLSLDAQTEQ